MKDDLIKAIRDVRHEISERCNHDAKTLIDYYKAKQQLHPERLVDTKKFMLEEEEIKVSVSKPL